MDSTIPGQMALGYIGKLAHHGTGKQNSPVVSESTS